MRFRSIVWALLLLCWSLPADAFCGFYVSGADAELFNNATMVVLMRQGKRTVLSMQNNYQGPPEDFAMVVPVPVVLQQDHVKTLPAAVFDRVDRLAAPRLVEYWEQDPCAQPMVMASAGVPTPRKFGAPTAAEGASDDLGVEIEAQFEVGEYQIVILSARDSSGLDTWLKREGYQIPQGAEPLLRPYVQAGMKFFVAKVDVKKVTIEGGQVMLSPLRFHYDDDEFRLPVRLGLVNSAGTQDLIVHILARNQRYEVANYDNVTIPTNIDVSDAVRQQFGTFYAALFDATIAKNPKAVVTEYSWDSSSCDPCPVPALRPNELATLGADVLPPGGDSDETGASNAPATRRRPVWRGGMVLTRLHVRYQKNGLGEDLVFKQAEPIGGGREIRGGQESKLEHGATKGSMNNFQARYAIRHRWKGKVACDDPIYGRWGGPPEGQRKQQTQAATGLAFAPRGKVKFASLLKSSVPELGIEVKVDDPPVKPTSGADPPTSAKPGSSSGCGCHHVASVGSMQPLAWLLLVPLLRRRRRR